MTGPIKWHGGKGAFNGALANWIISLMPPRCKNPNKPDPGDPGWLHYVEPYFGGGAVLLANDPEGISEVVNDINFGLTNFWNAIQDNESFNEFNRRVEAVPFSESEFNQPLDKLGGMTALAVNFFVRCRQSLSGRMKGFASITKNRTRRGMNEQTSAWLSAIEGLPEVHARLKRVVILNQDAIQVIKAQDGPRTLFYLDPPYLHETRASTEEYEHEMTEAQHEDLLKALLKIQGRFLLSGYPSQLYESYSTEGKWNRHEFKIANNAAGGKSKRTMTECVWTNF
jgi:DNA adenine methylase